MCAVKHRESLIVYQSGRMSLIQEDIKPTQTCCQLCVCCFLEKSSLMNVRQLPTWATVMHTSPTCHLALSITQTEALGSNKTGTWIFPYGILAINWLGHKLPVGLTLSNFTFLRSFLAKATNRLKIKGWSLPWCEWKIWALGYWRGKWFPQLRYHLCFHFSPQAKAESTLLNKALQHTAFSLCVSRCF